MRAETSVGIMSVNTVFDEKLKRKHDKLTRHHEAVQVWIDAQSKVHEVDVECCRQALSEAKQEFVDAERELRDLQKTVYVGQGDLHDRRGEIIRAQAKGLDVQWREQALSKAKQDLVEADGELKVLKKTVTDLKDDVCDRIRELDRAVCKLDAHLKEGAARLSGISDKLKDLDEAEAAHAKRLRLC